MYFTLTFTILSCKVVLVKDEHSTLITYTTDEKFCRYNVRMIALITKKFQKCWSSVFSAPILERAQTQGNTSQNIKDWATRIPLKMWDEFMYSRRVSSSCSTSDNRHGYESTTIIYPCHALTLFCIGRFSSNIISSIPTYSSQDLDAILCSLLNIQNRTVPLIQALRKKGIIYDRESGHRSQCLPLNALPTEIKEICTKVGLKRRKWLWTCYDFDNI
jgi:hypothetical protein